MSEDKSKPRPVRVEDSQFEGQFHTNSGLPLLPLPENVQKQLDDITGYPYAPTNSTLPPPPRVPRTGTTSTKK